MLGSDALAWRSDRTDGEDAGDAPPAGGPTPTGAATDHRGRRRRVVATLIGVAGLAALGVQPVAAQSAGQAFCDTALVKTLGNLLTVIQMGGPLLGGLVALGATVSMPMVRRTDVKREIKTARNQGLVWGIIVAPLATTIIKFLLQHVVVGAPTCGF